MPFDWGTLFILSLLGGFIAIDGTSVGQFMVSRPFVAASLSGWIAGEPAQGAQIGLVLETFHLSVLPVGAAKYPEGGPAAVAAGAVYATSNFSASTLLLIVVGALLLEGVGGETVRYLRQLNVRIMQGTRGDRLLAAALERGHIAAIALDFLRGTILVAAGVAILFAAVRFLTPFWALSDHVAEVVLMAAVAGLLASAFRVVGSRFWFTAAGAAAGLALFLLAA